MTDEQLGFANQNARFLACFIRHYRIPNTSELRYLKPWYRALFDNRKKSAIMKRRNLLLPRLIPGELYLFHRTDPECPADGSLFGIFDEEISGAVYLESCIYDLHRFRLACRLPEGYRFRRLADRSELRDYVFNLACHECETRRRF